MICYILHAFVRGAKAEYAVVKFGEEKKPVIKSWLDTEVTMSVRTILTTLGVLVLMTMTTLYIYYKPCTSAPCEKEKCRGPHSATEEPGEQGISTDEEQVESLGRQSNKQRSMCRLARVGGELALPAHETSHEARIAKLMQLRQDDLKQACLSRGLPISGNKTELARRLIAPPVASRPTEKQLSYIAALEKKNGVATNPDAQLCKREASRWIEELTP